MNKALLGAFASVALLGASCSVQDFSTVVMDKPTITASFDFEAPTAEITTMDELEDYYGKYSFRYGYFSNNLLNASKIYDYVNNHYLDGRIVCKNTSNTSGDFKVAFLNGGSVVSYALNQIGDSGFYSFSCTRSVNWNRIELLLSGNYSDAYVIYDFNALNIPYNVDLTFSFDLQFSLTACVISNLMINKGTTALPYQPYGIGMAFETPVSGAKSVAYTLDSNGDIVSRMVYSDNDAYPELRNFYAYFDSLHWMLDNATYEAFVVSLNDALSNAVMRNIDGFDYDRDGSFDLMWTVENPYDAYLEFTIGSPLPDRFKDTMLDGLESLYYSLSDGTTTKTGYLTPSSVFFDAMDGLLTNGLLDIQGFKAWLVNRQDVSFSGGVEMQLNFDYGLNGKDLLAAPVYVDNKSYGPTTDLALMPMVSAKAVINLGNRWTCFQLNLNSTYAGDALGYSNSYSTINDKSYYRELEIFTPRNQSANELRYVGVLSSYARGYADGVASRDGEVDDLTERILSLEEDLTQYQGKSYQQIYDLGKQAGMNLATNAGAATFNSLFGNILTAPLTILNGLMPMEFFGMPILTAILSLLMVALALWLFKRFK